MMEDLPLFCACDPIAAIVATKMSVIAALMRTLSALLHGCAQAKNLHAPVLAVCNVDFAVLAKRDSSGKKKFTWCTPRTSERKYHLTFLVKGLNAVKAAFHHHDPALLVHRYSFRLVKFSGSVSQATKRGKKFAGCIQVLYAEIERVNNPERAIRCDGDMSGIVELNRPIAGLAEAVHNFSVHGKHQHAHGRGIDYIEQIFGWIDSKSGAALEEGFIFAKRAKGLQEFPIRTKYKNQGAA